MSGGLYKTVRLLGISLLMLMTCDVIAAQAFKLFLAGPDRDEIEREYRRDDSVYHHDLVPNMDVRGIWGGRRYPIRTNSLGFKDARVRDVPLTSDRERVLFMGDSFTEGIGIEYPQTFVGRIEAQLAKDGVEVLNAGVVTYAPSIYYRKVKYLIEVVGLEFDEIVVSIDISDIEDEARFYELDAEGRVRDEARPADAEPSETAPPRAEQLKQFVKSNSVLAMLADVVKDALLDDGGWDPILGDSEAIWHRLRHDPRGAWTVDPQAYEDFGREGLIEATASMDKLDALVRQHGIPMTIVTYPWPAQILARDLDSRQRTHWRAWAAARQHGFIDLFPAFVDSDEARDPRETVERLFLAGDVHWNEAGHALVAERILAAYRPGAHAQSAKQAAQ